MGMFDEVHCKFPLPEYDGDGNFQTKDFDCLMDSYTITEDGRLVLEQAHYEHVPLEDRPYPNGPGFLEMLGCLRRVVDGMVDTDFHGDMEFYDSKNYFRARFTEGKLQWIRRTPSPWGDDEK